MGHYIRICLKFGLLIALVVALWLTFHRGYLDEGEIHRFVTSAGPFAAPGFILMFGVGVALLVPPPMLIGSGAVAFGTTLGPIYSLLGMIVGACAAFLIGKYVAPGFAKKRRKGKLKSIDRWLELNGIAFMISLRLTFFGNPALNYAASLTPIKLRDYVFGSCIGFLPSVFLVTYIIDALTHTESPTDMLLHPAVASVVLLRLVGVALFVLLSKKYEERSLAGIDYA